MGEWGELEWRSGGGTNWSEYTVLKKNIFSNKQMNKKRFPLNKQYNKNSQK